MKKAALHNLGCKVNAYETEAMQQILEKGGYEIVPFAPGADVYLINTCTVTNIADRKSRQMIHKAKKMNPNAIVVAAGCYVQAAVEQGKVDECIDIVIGNNKKGELLSILAEYEASRGEQALQSLVDIAHTNEYETLSLERTAEHTRAYIKVQDGCNQFCSYCIIPYARGRVRSRKKAEVLEEVNRLAQGGYQEVVLTGIHLSSYGVDFTEEKENLLTLICAIHQVEGIKRIRLGSLEPRIITEEFIEVLQGLDKFCPHFHLSLQSGCDSTLKRMNRKYTAAEFQKACARIRQAFPHPALTTDVIVGFPGETEAEFQITKEFLEHIQFYETHIFKYSKRQGTKAAVMEDQIDESIKTKRSHILAELNKKNYHQFLEYEIGKKVEILIEEPITLEGKEYQIGHTKEYIKVAIPNSGYSSNQLVSGVVTGFVTNEILLCEEVK